jgi:hypothetical protein
MQHDASGKSPEKKIQEDLVATCGKYHPSNSQKKLWTSSDLT